MAKPRTSPSPRATTARVQTILDDNPDPVVVREYVTQLVQQGGRHRLTVWMKSRTAGGTESRDLLLSEWYDTAVVSSLCVGMQITALAARSVIAQVATHGGEWPSVPPKPIAGPPLSEAKEVLAE